MDTEERNTPPISEDEGSDNDSTFDEGTQGDLGEFTQELTMDDPADFMTEDPEDEPCDYELLDEMTDDEQSHVVTKSTTIHTTEYITKFEKTRVLGWRAQQIKSGAPPMIRADEKDENGEFIFKDGKYPAEPYDIAIKELNYGRCPVIISRRFPNGERIMIPVSKLKLI